MTLKKDYPICIRKGCGKQVKKPNAIYCSTECVFKKDSKWMNREFLMEKLPDLLPLVFGDDPEFLEYKVDQFLADPKGQEKFIFQLMDSYKQGTPEYKELRQLWKDLLKK